MRALLSIAASGAAAGAALSWLAPPAAAQQRRHFDPDAVYRVPLGSKAMRRGPDAAPVTLVEFSAYSCPYCLRARSTVRALARLYPGRLRLIYRHNPLDPKSGVLAAQAVLAAGAQGQLWPMHLRLYAGPKPITRRSVEAYAAELGLDMARFRAALDDGTYLAAVREDLEDAARLGATTTPMFFVNGRPIRGARPLSVFAGVVERELERASKLRATTEPGRAMQGDRLYRRLVERGARRGSSSEVDESSYDELTKLDPAAVYRVGLGLPGHRTGPDDAPVTLVEFSDFSCGFCARVQKRIEALRARYGARLRLVFRHLPQLPGAQLAAEAAVEAARQNKLWPFRARVFAHGGKTRAALEAHARAVGMDVGALRRALDRRSHRAAVASDATAAALLGASGTPIFFVNGTPLVGDRPLHEFEALIDAKLVEAKKLIDSGVAPADVYRASLRGAVRGEKLKTRSAARSSKTRRGEKF